mmetsp:Transcript_6660/g.11757  ORF Transcript_6660/g.11757 Transcript_6660/m.11757 type:complete len:347 (+) Transcript_6660:5649-6689(+)
MSGMLKWMETKLEKINAIAEGLNEDSKPDDIDDASLHEIKLLQEQVVKLRGDLRTVRNLCEQQVNELHDKYKAQVEGLQAQVDSIRAQYSKVSTENSFLCQQRDVIEQQLNRMQQLNSQLIETLEKEPEPQQQTEENQEYIAGELSITKQYLANVKALLAAEKLKSEDSTHERIAAEQRHIAEIEKLTLQISMLEGSKDALQLELSELKEQFEETKKVEKGYTTQQNMQALADHLQTKQRTIESLLSERATLLLQLEREKSENLRLIQTSGTTIGLARQPLSSLGVFRGKKVVRRVADWVDGGVSELGDIVREQAVIRLLLIVYLVVIHMWLLYSFTSPSQPQFLE